MKENIISFEKQVQYVCKSMNVDRDEAISRIMKITDSIDADGLCHHYGLPISYLKEQHDRV